jgi:hypothetical protein
MRVPARHGRKILVASIGVATMHYVIACGNSQSSSNGDGGSGDEGNTFDSPVGNLGPTPDAHTRDTIDDTPVANLVAADISNDTKSTDTIDETPVANLVVSPDSGDAH